MAAIVKYNGRKVTNSWLRALFAIGAMGFFTGLLLFLVLAVFPLAGIVLTFSAGLVSFCLALAGFVLLFVAIVLPMLFLAGSLVGLCYAPFWLVRGFFRR